jgi:ribosome-associated toxin RatA of RatAB toxin-antitoxin module
VAEQGSASIEIDARPEDILEVITNVDVYPEWMSPFRKAVVLERDDAGRPKRAEFAVDAKLQVINYTLEYEYPPAGVAWDSVAGDMKQIKGGYDLAGHNAGTTVTYYYTIDPGFPIPGFLMKKAVKLLVTTALEDLKARVETIERSGR